MIQTGKQPIVGVQATMEVNDDIGDDFAYLDGCVADHKRETLADSRSRYHSFHARMKALLAPDGDGFDRPVVAVLANGLHTTSSFSGDDVEILECDYETTMADLAQQYRQKHSEGLDTVFRFKDDILPSDTKVKDLRCMEGDLLALQAVTVYPNGAHAPESIADDFPSIDRYSDEPIYLSTANRSAGSKLFGLTANSCTDMSTEQLLKCSLQGKRTLRKILPLLESTQFPDATRISERITQLLQKAYTVETIIGIFGEMGAGKSAMLNALLREIALLLTSGSQACTFVVTEIRYNRDPNWHYRAEIHLISLEEAHKLLSSLFHEILDYENLHELERDDDARRSCEMAREQLSTLLPEEALDTHFEDLTIERIAERVPRLINAYLAQKLGHIIRVREKKAKSFVESMNEFVGPDNGYGPLIKVVKIFTKADILATGAVLVDLPGFNDINRARSTVAEEYLKRCSRIWIVTPITRAVSSRCALELLSKSLSIQLRMDGTMGSITFICTQTDRIKIREALRIEGTKDRIRASGVTERFEAVTKTMSEHQAQEKKLASRRAICEEQIEVAIENTTLWCASKKRVSSGLETLAPEPVVISKKAAKKKALSLPDQQPQIKSQKRKFNGDPLPSQVSVDTATMQMPAVPCTIDLTSQSASSTTPLTSAEVERQLAKLATAVTTARQELQLISEEGRKLDILKESEQAELDQIHCVRLNECIKSRNAWSCGVIKSKFAREQKSLDDSINIEDAARSLPVFAISANAYQTMSRKPGRTPRTEGFFCAEDTGIPQLRQHCIRETDRARRDASSDFLASLYDILNFLSRWAIQDDFSGDMLESERKAEAESRQNEQKKLKGGKMKTYCIVADAN